MIQVFDDFLSDPGVVRQSALTAGFGNWTPATKGDIGLETYSGVGYWGDHAKIYQAIFKKFGTVVPSSHFFRMTNPSMEKAIVHSDRGYGEITIILYLSPDVEKGSGTAFYRHRRTGLVELPPLEELMKREDFHSLNADMNAARDEDWIPYRFVEGKYNRCLAFSAPLLHCRLPKTGFGTGIADSRLVWVGHATMFEG